MLEQRPSRSVALLAIAIGVVIGIAIVVLPGVVRAEPWRRQPRGYQKPGSSNSQGAMAAEGKRPPANRRPERARDVGSRLSGALALSAAAPLAAAAHPTPAAASSAQHPATAALLRTTSAHVVFARCAEAGSTAVQQLSAAGIPFTIVQKACAPHGNRTLLQLEAAVRASNARRPARDASWLGAGHKGSGATLGMSQVLKVDHNQGDECSAYLHYIVHNYDALAPLTMFVQFGAENRTICQGANPCRGIARLSPRPLDR